MTEQRLQELDELRRREKRLRDLSKHFQRMALKRENPEIQKFIERDDEHRMESLFLAANHISLGAWVRIGAIIESEWEQARQEFEQAQ